jgi:prophage DNA circulation protein
LIGSDQLDLSTQMARAAESPEPGHLIHPIFGDQMVSCVTLKISADYKKDIKRTKLAFEFIEAHTSLAPFKAGEGSLEKVFTTGSDAVDASKTSGEQRWAATAAALMAAADISRMLESMIAPAKDEESFDAQSALLRLLPILEAAVSVTTPVVGLSAMEASATTVARLSSSYQTFADVTNPIDFGTATIRRIHATALTRLREFNHYIVATLTQRTPSIEALMITARLALIRDYAIVVAQATYKTVHEALKDLDFVVAVYDDEELAATALCDDALVKAIRTARAGAISTILVRNIRLPGIVDVGVGGVWPSFLVAHKRYFDGRRYQEIEDYNSNMPPFFIGRNITAPAY